MAMQAAALAAFGAARARADLGCRRARAIVAAAARGAAQRAGPGGGAGAIDAPPDVRAVLGSKRVGVAVAALELAGEKGLGWRVCSLARARNSSAQQDAALAAAAMERAASRAVSGPGRA